MSAPVSIPLSVPNISGNEWRYVKSALDDGWVSTAGPFVDRFEREFAAAAKVPHAVAVMNGTAALHLCLKMVGVTSGDLVVTTPLTFIAPVNAIHYCGAAPKFIDVDPTVWQMDPHQTVRYLREECEPRENGTFDKTTGQRVAAIMPVHILGHPVDMDPILEIAHELGIPVIEDATESLGAWYKGKPVGTLGTFGCFSFNGNKLVTTGGGGMITTNDPELAKRAKYLSNTAKDEPIEFVHGEVGYNYRLTNLQAAMGVAQIEQLTAFLQRKREVFEVYNHAFADLEGFRPMPEADWCRSACWLYTALFAPESRTLLHALAEEGIQTRPLWQPIHKSPAYPTFNALTFPETERIAQQALSLPCSTHITEEQVNRVVEAVRRVITSPQPR
ncbi:MAG: LegC family aminotransferase [Fimbriimonadaceae bacterium]|nr:LegC family aminotransferase [Fimbriimonadaceae bacterium]